EAPHLPEDDREREQEARVEADHERGDEGLGGAERDEAAPLRRQRLLEPVDQVRVEGVGEPEADDERDQRDDDPRTKLAEMLDEGRLLSWVKAPRQQPHGATRRCRARGARRGAALPRPSPSARPETAAR